MKEVTNISIAIGQKKSYRRIPNVKVAKPNPNPNHMIHKALACLTSKKHHQPHPPSHQK